MLAILLGAGDASMKTKDPVLEHTSLESRGTRTQENKFHPGKYNILLDKRGA